MLFVIEAVQYRLIAPDPIVKLQCLCKECFPGKITNYYSGPAHLTHPFIETRSPISYLTSKYNAHIFYHIHTQHEV